MSQYGNNGKCNALQPPLVMVMVMHYIYNQVMVMHYRSDQCNGNGNVLHIESNGPKYGFFIT